MSSIAEHATTGGRQLARRLDVRSDHHADSGARRKEVASPRVGPTLGHSWPRQPAVTRARPARRVAESSRRPRCSRCAAPPRSARAPARFAGPRALRPQPRSWASTRRAEPSSPSSSAAPRRTGTPGRNSTQVSSLCATQPRARQTGRLHCVSTARTVAVRGRGNKEDRRTRNAAALRRTRDPIADRQQAQQHRPTQQVVASGPGALVLQRVEVAGRRWRSGLGRLD
jgi:hypothetical protein